MDGVAGLEPANDRIKICWLTDLPIPHLNLYKYSDEAKKSSESLMALRVILVLLKVA